MTRFSGNLQTLECRYGDVRANRIIHPRDGPGIVLGDATGLLESGALKGTFFRQNGVPSSRGLNELLQGAPALGLCSHRVLGSVPDISPFDSCCCRLDSVNYIEMSCFAEGEYRTCFAPNGGVLGPITYFFTNVFITDRFSSCRIS